MPYNQLVIALGAMTNLTMIPGSEHAFTFKTLADAFLLRNHIIERFERADVEHDPVRKRRQLTFVIIGGGLVGVELFGELTGFADGIAPLYKHVDRDEVRFILLQAGDRLMPEIDPKLAAYGTDVLRQRRGAEIRTNSKVEAIEPGVYACRARLLKRRRSSWRRVLCRALLSPSCRWIKTRGISWSKDHALQESSRGMGAGRLRSVPGPDGKPYPGLAQHALREAKVLARNIIGARWPNAAAVYLRHAGNDGFAGSQQRVRHAH